MLAAARTKPSRKPERPAPASPRQCCPGHPRPRAARAADLVLPDRSDQKPPDPGRPARAPAQPSDHPAPGPPGPRPRPPTPTATQNRRTTQHRVRNAPADRDPRRPATVRHRFNGDSTCPFLSPITPSHQWRHELVVSLLSPGALSL
jgi:hypothetical protein